MIFPLCAATLLAALLLGGGTHSGFPGDVFVQMLSIALLMAALWPAYGDDELARQRARMALAICACCAIVVFLQVCPLPFDIWSGRAGVFPDGDKTRAAGWTTLSMAPQASLAAAISLLVPLAVFSAVLQLGFKQRMLLCRLILGVGAVSVALGFLQVAEGLESPLRFYAVTNLSEPVGFFANRNHFAAFLNVTLVLAGVWLAQTLEASPEKGALETRSFLWISAAGAFFVVIVAGLAMARSRAGVIIAMVALAAIVTMMLGFVGFNRTQEPPRQKLRMGRVPLAIALFAVLFTLQFGLGRLLTRFEGDPADDLRIPLNVTTAETALRVLPFGTGLGSFVPVYATVEKNADAISVFANRAHNDFAELLLETGLIGAGLGVLFLTWFIRRSRAVWFGSQTGAGSLRVLLDRASSFILVLLLLHSLVDYPLRTTALGVVFAFFCGILAVPVVEPKIEDQPAPPRRHKSRKAGIVPIAPLSGTMEWPKEWQREESEI